MNKLMQRKYIIGALIIYVILIIISFLTGGFPYLTGDFISFGQLVLELFLLPTVIIGFFIAIEEFRKAQIKPDLELIIGSELPDGTINPLRVEIDPLRGVDNIHAGYTRPPVSRLRFGLFLENNHPKAARYVRITLRLKEAKRPLEFYAVRETFEDYIPKVNRVISEAIFLQFGEDCIVYKGDGVFLDGLILVEWQKDERPEKLVLEAGLYNLEGEPKTVVITRPIEWN